MSDDEDDFIRPLDSDDDDDNNDDEEDDEYDNLDEQEQNPEDEDTQRRNKTSKQKSNQKDSSKDKNVKIERKKQKVKEHNKKVKEAPAEIDEDYITERRFKRKKLEDLARDVGEEFATESIAPHQDEDSRRKAELKTAVERYRRVRAVQSNMQKKSNMRKSKNIKLNHLKYTPSLGEIVEELELGDDYSTIQEFFDASQEMANQILDLFKEEHLLTIALIEFIMIYEDILLAIETNEKKIRRANQFAITTFYLWDCRYCLEASHLPKKTQERLILDRFIKGSFYLERILTMLRLNYIKDESKYVYFQDILLDVEYRNILLDTVKHFHNENLRKKRTVHRKASDLNSAMFEMGENFYQMASKKLRKGTFQDFTPFPDVIDAGNIINITKFFEVDENTGKYKKNNRSTLTVFMLFDATLLKNNIEPRETFRSYSNLSIIKTELKAIRELKEYHKQLKKVQLEQKKEEEEEENGAGKSQNKKEEEEEGKNKKGNSAEDEESQVYVFTLDQIAYIDKCGSMVEPISSIYFSYKYRPLLKILSICNVKLYNLTSKAASSVLVLFRYNNREHPRVNEFEINDVLEMIISDDYSRSVFCELVGQERIKEQSQTYRYLTRIQLHMAVNLAEQHVRYLSKYLTDKFLGL